MTSMVPAALILGGLDHFGSWSFDFLDFRGGGDRS